MKKGALTIFLFLICVSVAFAQEGEAQQQESIRLSQEYDLRKVKWGMTFDEVVEAEEALGASITADRDTTTGKVKSVDHEVLWTEDNLVGNQAYVKYEFFNKLVIKASMKVYNIDELFYNIMVKNMREKYGKPASGEGSKLTNWENDDTVINMHWDNAGHLNINFTAKHPEDIIKPDPNKL